MANSEQLPYGCQYLPQPVKTYHPRTYDRIAKPPASLDLKDKTLFVTGATSGVGLAIVKAFAAAGIHRIIAIARRPDPLTETKRMLASLYPEVQVVIHATDASDTGRLEEIVREVGRIDILVLNAAAVDDPTVPLGEIKKSHLMESFETNTIAPFILSQAVMANNSKLSVASLTVIYISSADAAYSGADPRQTCYSASKTAAQVLMTGFAQKYESVRTFSIHPGAFWTPTALKSMGDEFEMVKSMIQEEDLNLPAHFCVWLTSSEADFLNGRMVFPHWDLDELLAIKDEIVKKDYLKIGLVGINELAALSL